jgi:hypothetical protein
MYYITQREKTRYFLCMFVQNLDKSTVLHPNRVTFPHTELSKQCKETCKDETNVGGTKRVVGRQFEWHSSDLWTTKSNGKYY